MRKFIVISSIKWVQSFVIDDDGATEEIYQVVFLDNGKVFDCYTQKTGIAYTQYNENFIHQSINDVKHMKAIITTIDDDNSDDNSDDNCDDNCDDN